ncbi:MAG: hypothetical protein NW207_00890 [Cytophagales bacterium]|nr:hypothetical protein [Cytophagales bacterium]
MARIIDNRDSTYSAFIDFRCIFTGTFEDCVREIMYFSIGI